MEKIRPGQFLASAFILQSILSIDEPIRAIQFLYLPGPTSWVFALVSLSCWTSLLLAGIGLLRGHWWGFCLLVISGFLSPFTGLPLVPFVFSILPFGVLDYLSVLVVVNLVVVLLAWRLSRNDATTPALGE